jgi:hypothetical protein
MQLTRAHALTAMAILETAGLKRPAIIATEEQLHAAADLWVDMFPGMDARTFADAVKGHLRDRERGRFWPTPSDILASAERIAAAKFPSGAAAFADVFWVRGSFGSARKDEAIAFLTTEKGYPKGKLLAGIDAIGGWHAIGALPDPKYGGNAYGHQQAKETFAAAYTAAPADSTALAVA